MYHFCILSIVSCLNWLILIDFFLTSSHIFLLFCLSGNFYWMADTVNFALLAGSFFFLSFFPFSLPSFLSCLSVSIYPSICLDGRDAMKLDLLSLCFFQFHQPGLAEPLLCRPCYLGSTFLRGLTGLDVLCVRTFLHCVWWEHEPLAPMEAPVVVLPTPFRLVPPPWWFLHVCEPDHCSADDCADPSCCSLCSCLFSVTFSPKKSRHLGLYE